MLDKNALSQLQGLKDKIEADKESAQGSVKGTRNRFGFVVLDDNREIFLPPDEMQRVLPGDRVAITIKPVPAKDKTAKAQTAAELETLIRTSVDCFVGEVVQKGKAFFVAPDTPEIPNFTRWLFITPSGRAGAKHGDLVHCQLQRHPFQDGKPAVKILKNFGSTETAGIENTYCIARAGIERYLTSDVQQTLNDALGEPPEASPQRTDLRDLALVSIDAASTLDIDDAICAEPRGNGWRLTVAIADPTALVGHASSLTESIALRGTSHYFHGTAIPLLPESLSRAAALMPNEDRAALVCQLDIGETGETESAALILATVQSKAKLSYLDVEEIVSENVTHALSEQIQCLRDCFLALRAWREANELVIEHRSDYRWILNDRKQIETIEEVEKKTSHFMVEECMIAANKALAQALKDGNRPGPFVTHAGIRRDKSTEATEFLQRFLPEQVDTDFTSVAGFRILINALKAASVDKPLRSMVNRLMARASFSVKPAPHMGMAVPLYTTGTSPLRKAFDYCVHLQIKTLLGDTALKPAPATVFDLINQASAKNRQAVNAAQRWLTSNFLNEQAGSGTTEYDAEIVHITPSGFTIKLHGLGLEGAVDVKGHPEKFSFDKWEMALTSKTQRFELRQHVRVVYHCSEKPRGDQPVFQVIEATP